MTTAGGSKTNRFHSDGDGAATRALFGETSQRYLRQPGGNSSWEIAVRFDDGRHQDDSRQDPQKPLIFYQQILNEQGVEELKPILYLPPPLLEQARAQQTGNAFAKVLASFREGTTSEEMVESLPEESGVRIALVEFFRNNPKTKEAVTEAAERARLTETPLEEPLSLTLPIQAEHIAIVTEGDLHLEANQKGKTAAFVSKKGSITLGSKKKRQQNGSHFEDQISDQRTLTYEGHLGLRAGQDIQTQAVKINVGSLQIDAQGNVMDSAVMLDSHSETEAPGVRETRGGSDAHVSQFEVQGKMGVKAQNIALLGPQTGAFIRPIPAPWTIDTPVPGVVA